MVTGGGGGAGPLSHTELCAHGKGRPREHEDGGRRLGSGLGPQKLVPPPRGGEGGQERGMGRGGGGGGGLRWGVLCVSAPLPDLWTGLRDIVWALRIGRWCPTRQRNTIICFFSGVGGGGGTKRSWRSPLPV